MAASIMPDTQFQEFLATGRFMMQRSHSSGRFVFPPRIAEPGTGARDLEWVEPSGRGTLYSITFIVKRDPADNYNVALIDLQEGPRVLARLQGVTQETAKIGMAVHAKVEVNDGTGLLVFVVKGVETTGRAKHD
ncbi:hypothetical protein PT7_2678 [Pusillimonas sp. T7-7]|uniref:Zn-ribbon domain-containing OB-fold protein n=1 Tax=Pusillimonas sp. (strain T7-7) TaxID=1007105 RepID=UPI0002084F5E|nr:OB-fold domain-containing protein [Pusillimonas sp. T7-7]AEC21218.1 hypothetical protein PT7_2678 [Pusillimonas sp. T7-7]